MNRARLIKQFYETVGFVTLRFYCMII